MTRIPPLSTVLLLSTLLGYCRSLNGSMKFVTNKMCPYAQKAWIALEVAKCHYELVEVGLYGSGGKPDWFWKLNPKGTVPVLVCNDGTEENGHVVLPDSDLILNYLQDEISNPLNPPPDIKSIVQTWRNRIRYMLPVGKRAVLGGNKNELQKCLREMDSAVVGPFLAGDVVTAADCHAFPFVWRLDQEYGLKEYPNLSAWLSRCSKEPAFQKTIQSAWWWWW
jgi:glutathione S-transferase